MTETSRNGAGLVKAALVEYERDSPSSRPNVIVFQYNPSELSRELLPSGAEAGTGVGRRAVPSQPPTECITLNIVLDATDPPETGSPAATKGVYPTIAALELLMHHQCERGTGAGPAPRGGARGRGKGAGAKGPVVLFLWGADRTLPVKILSMLVRETAFDASLNPVRADVAMRLEVLRPDEMKKGGIAHRAHAWTRQRKETIAGSDRISTPKVGSDRST